jgi:hypothetical protein
MRGEAAGAVAVLEGIDAQFHQVPGFPEALPAFLFYPWLTLRHGLVRRRALLEWIDECLGYLDRRPDTADDDAGSEALAELLRAMQLVADQTSPREQQENEND